MKAVLISTQPKWCELIASGKKTVEVRKSKPKLETPFKCYIYCTKDEQYEIAPFRFEDGWHIKRFNAKTNWANGCTANMGEELNGKVIGEFVCDRMDEYKNNFCAWRDKNGKQFDVGKLLSDACLTLDKMSNYVSASVKFYGWHISDLKIYDKPKELSEFKKGCNDMDDPMYGSYCEYCENKCYLKRAPQSWCYVEEL